MVLIGIDPHKASHTAVAVDDSEAALAELTVRADRYQVERLLKWAIDFPDRSWAIESANGLGHLLGQQLLAAGEEVVDVPPTLSARVRVLASGRSQKNDPNDALSTAIAALRAPRLRTVARGASRFDLKYGMVGLPHDAIMRTIELYGTKVVPLARELLADAVPDPVA